MSTNESEIKSSFSWYICGGCCCVYNLPDSYGLSLHQSPIPSITGDTKQQREEVITSLKITEDDSEHGLNEEESRYPPFLRESTRSIDLNDPITLEELQKSIPTIDNDLDQNIKSWEDSFRKYEELENKSLEVIGPELVKVLIKLRDDPDAFINSTNPAIRSLARTRTSLYASTSPHDSKDHNSSLEIQSDSNHASRRKSFNFFQQNNLSSTSTSTLASSLTSPSIIHSQRRGSMPDMRPLSMNSIVSSTHGERPSDMSIGGNGIGNGNGHGVSSSFSHHRNNEIISNSREGTILAFGERRIQSVAITRSTGGIKSFNNTPNHNHNHNHNNHNNNTPNHNGNNGNNSNSDNNNNDNLYSPQTMGTRELSLIWAGRLAEMSPTQGQLCKQVGMNGQVLGLKMTPKWPGWLSDCLYDVIKINKFGKRQRRTLKLTEFHVVNIKDGKSVTKVIPYDGIHQINLTSSRSFTIDYELKRGVNDIEVGTLFYESMLSAHIVQQVTTRTQVRRDLDKIGKLSSTSKTIDQNRVGYSVGVTEAMIHAITDLITKDDSDITQFAQLLGKRALEQIQSLIINPPNENEVFTIASSPSSHITSSSSAPPTSSPFGTNSIDVPVPRERNQSMIEVKPNSIKRLLSIQQGSGEYKLKSLVQKIILDVSSPEGNTLRHFIKKFPEIPKDQNMIELRHFIDGLYEYLIENHVTLFTTCLNSPNDLNDSTHSTKQTTGRVASNSTASTPSPSSSNPLRISWGTSSTIDLYPMSETSPIPSFHLTEELLISISYITYTVVEETLFLALQPKIISYCLAHEIRKNAEDIVLRKMKVLAGRTQQDFEIPDDHRSPNDWSTAIFELAGIERNPTPSMRIHALVRTARAIYTEYKTQIVPLKQLEKNQKNNFSTSKAPFSSNSETNSNLDNNNSDEYVLGADDFLPIFIFIFCRSELYHPIQNKDLLWKLCHPDQLQGESGYYLTIYESAVEYVLAYEIPDSVLKNVVLNNPDVSKRLTETNNVNSSNGNAFSRLFSSKHRRFSTFT